HADDRLRGMSTNPFNVNTRALVITAKGQEKGNGPFPGDDILYSFKLYSDPKLEKRTGSAMFTCYYTFVKRATCDSYFELDGGLVLASGRVVFNGTRFTLGVSGGTGKYLGTLGEVRASPAAATSARSLTVYALATRAQFTNHADDRQRGLSSNPFNVDTKKLPPILKSEKGKGG